MKQDKNAPEQGFALVGGLRIKTFEQLIKVGAADSFPFQKSPTQSPKTSGISVKK